MNTEKLKQLPERSTIDGESLTKLALNNKIVEMRKNVRQSRVQSINKMIREIRRLKIKKGTEEQISKNLKKVERLMEQMAVMKKVNPDVVSKFALQNEKSLEKITNDVNETVENKALARLACHKSVNQKVLEFREKFPDWSKSLILLLESLGEKYKNKKQTPAVSKKKEKTMNSTRKNNSFDKEVREVANINRAANVKNSSGLWTVSTCESEDVDSGDGSEDSNDLTDIIDQSTASAMISNSDESCDEGLDCEEKHVKTSADVQMKSKIKKSQVPDVRVKTESTEVVSNENITNTLSSLSPHKISNVSNSKPKSKKLQVLNGNVETESSIQNNSKIVLKTESPSPPPKSIKTKEESGNISNSNIPVAADSFFMTKDNKEYMSMSVRQSDDTEESSVSQKEPRRMKPYSKPERFHTKSDQFKSKSNQFKPQSNQFKPKSNQSNFGKRKNFDSTRGKPGYAKDTSAAPSLHPSWVAKKKQTTIIQNSQFQGKKIKFNE